MQLLELHWDDSLTVQGGLRGKLGSSVANRLEKRVALYHWLGDCVTEAFVSQEERHAEASSRAAIESRTITLAIGDRGGAVPCCRLVLSFDPNYWGAKVLREQLGHEGDQEDTAWLGTEPVSQVIILLPAEARPGPRIHRRTGSRRLLLATGTIRFRQRPSVFMCHWAGR